MDDTIDTIPIKLPEICCACLGVPNKIVYYRDKSTDTAGNTSILTIPVPICTACKKKYKDKRIRTFLITLFICLSIGILYTLLKPVFLKNIFWGSFFGIAFGLIVSSTIGKPFFHSKGYSSISFDNDEYQKQFEELNKELFRKNHSKS